MKKPGGENNGRSYWNYRVIDHGHSFAIHEVHYEKDAAKACEGIASSALTSASCQ